MAVRGFIGACLGAFFALTPAAAANLVANPGLEGAFLAVAGCSNVAGTVAKGWSDNTCWDQTHPQIVYGPDVNSPHGGKSAQKVTLVSGSRAQVIQTLPSPLPAGTVYRISLWMRAATPMTVTLQLRQTGAPYSVYGSKQAVLTTDWRQQSFAAIDSGTSLSLIILTEASGSFSFDDASVVATGVAPKVPVPPTATIDAAYFGMQFNDLDTPWPKTGPQIGSTRIWDAGPNLDGSGAGSQWAEINPRAGTYDWRGLDRRVALAEAHGASLIYTLGGRTPTWASARPDVVTPYEKGSCAEPATDTLWQTWVTTIATRYKGRIAAWEIWNEPDGTQFYCGDPKRLVDFARMARVIVKAIDPAAKIVSPAMSGYAGTGALDLFLDQGGGAYVDVIGYHFYSDTPEDVRTRILNIRSVLSLHHLGNLAVWNTEQGWYDETNTGVVLSDTKGAAYLARSLLLNWAWGLRRYEFYTWDNSNNEIRFTSADRTTLTPPALAYAEVQRWMSGRRMTGITLDAAGIYCATLEGRGQPATHVVWTAAGATPLTVPSAWAAKTRTSVQGKSAPLPASGIVNVGSSPIRLD